MERERILERERRWAVPAAVLALVPIVLYIASIIIVQGADIASGNSEAEQLTSLHEHAGTVLTSAIVRGIGFLVLTLGGALGLVPGFRRETKMTTASAAT